MIFPVSVYTGGVPESALALALLVLVFTREDSLNLARELFPENPPELLEKNILSS